MINDNEIIHDLESTDKEKHIGLTYIEKQELINIKFREAELKSYEQDFTERRKYTFRIFTLLCIFLAASIIVVIVSGTGLLKLESTVLIALLGSTSIDVIGLFAIVTNYLFRK
jgi:hypothetical protein